MEVGEEGSCGIVNIVFSVIRWDIPTLQPVFFKLDIVTKL